MPNFVRTVKRYSNGKCVDSIVPQVGALCYLSSFGFLRWAYLKVTVTKETKRSFIHCFICQMTTIARTGWTWVDLGGPGCLELHPDVTSRWQGPSTWDAFCCFPRFIISVLDQKRRVWDASTSNSRIICLHCHLYHL